MGSNSNESGGYGVGVWVFIVGITLAILSGILLSQIDTLALALSPQAQRDFQLLTIIFLVGGTLSVLGLLTAIAERVVDYLAVFE